MPGAGLDLTWGLPENAGGHERSDSRMLAEKATCLRQQAMRTGLDGSRGGNSRDFEFFELAGE